ncbi:hypothetical protein [Leptothermofonsia sichuanensis]|uniref:hypothetical protein n=1 Tax=Leptothermofonsia sichuanensis TaxID=2917832 RepID=UPI0024C076E5
MSIAIPEAIVTLAEAEGTVTLLLASPLLAIAGFYDPPFRVRAEVLVQLTLDDGEEVLQGRIDVLVLLDQFWVVMLESKKTATWLQSRTLPGLTNFEANRSGN